MCQGLPNPDSTVRVLHGRGYQGKEGVTWHGPQASQAQPLAQHGTNQHSEPEGEDVITSPAPQRGTTGQSYLLRRLARDRPDILERVKAGEFKSARAAAIEARDNKAPNPQARG